MRQLMIATVLLAAFGAGGYKLGRDVERRALLDEVTSLNRTIQEAESARLRAEIHLLNLQETLNAQALADPDASRLSFGSDSVQRLNQVR